MSEARADNAPTLDVLRQNLALLTGPANKGRRKRLKQKIQRLDFEESLEEAEQERDRLKDVQKQRRKMRQQHHQQRIDSALLRAEGGDACGLPRASGLCRAAQQPENETKQQVFTFSEFVASAIMEEAVFA